MSQDSLDPQQGAPLRSETVRNAIAIPLKLDADGRVFRGGVVRRRWFGRRIEAIDPIFLRTNAVDVVPPEKLVERGLSGPKGPAIFGGMLRHPYGHFLLESCARLWFAHREPDLPIVFVNGGSLQLYQKQMIDLLGIKNDVFVTIRPLRFSKLLVPQPGFRITGAMHPDHARFLGRYEIPSDEPERPVWFSRTRLAPEHGGLVNEREVEERLEAAGWKIVHPERLSVEDQVRAVSGIRHLAGVGGSALHTVLLARTPPRQLTLLPRGMRHLPIQRILSDALNIHQVDLDLKTTLVDGTRAQRKWRLNDPQRAFAALVEQDEAARKRWPDGSLGRD